MGDSFGHHLIDPATGQPVETKLTTVTVIAGEAWWAEVLTKAAFVLGEREARALIEMSGAAAAFVTSDGGRIATESFAKWAA